MVEIGASKEREMKLRRPREAEFDLFVHWTVLGKGPEELIIRLLINNFVLLVYLFHYALALAPMGVFAM